MQVEGETGQANAHPWRLARGLLRPHLPALFLALLLMLVQSAATLAQPWLGGVLTDRLLVGSGVGPLLWVLFGLVGYPVLNDANSARGLMTAVGQRIGPQATIVTLMCDTGIKYLSTDVYRQNER